MSELEKKVVSCSGKVNTRSAAKMLAIPLWKVRYIQHKFGKYKRKGYYEHTGYRNRV